MIAALTDFGPGRSRAWANIDGEHFQLHDQGPGWAEVTEGSSVAGGVWERERYEWDSAGESVSVETLDSNTWAAGSRWDYKLRPAPGGGSSVEVTVVRNPKGLKGRLLALGLAMTGSRLLRSQMERALAARA